MNNMTKTVDQKSKSAFQDFQQRCSDIAKLLNMIDIPTDTTTGFALLSQAKTLLENNGFDVTQIKTILDSM